MRGVHTGVFIEDRVNWILLPALQDNYVLLLHHLPSNEVLCFDPGEWSPISEHLKTIGAASIRSVYLSHPHPDHVGALPELLKNQNCQLYSPEDARLAHFEGQALR
jgi:hydroxyacylglutathione hydrolase